MTGVNFKRCVNQNSSEMYKCDAESVIEELKVKMSRIKFRLLDCQNENQMLRKELLLAKKVIHEEISPLSAEDFSDLLNQAACVDFKGRREKVQQLKSKINELQNRIKELEGVDVKTGADGDADRALKVDVAESQKKYQSKKMMDKERQYLLENSCQLKRKLEVWKKRNAELSKEVNVLRLELDRLLEKSKEDQAIIDSYHVVEKELRARQTEKLNVRSKLDLENTRNEKLVDGISALKEDISAFLNKLNDDKLLIEALTNQQENLRDLLERQKRISESDNRRFRDELRDIQAKHATNYGKLCHLQDIVSEKSPVCLKLLESTKQKGFICSTECDKKEDSSPASLTANSETQKSELQQQPDLGKNDAPTEPSEEAPSRADIEEAKLKDECEQYKHILLSLQEETEQMTNTMASNDAKLNEWMSQLIQTRSLLAQKNAEIQDLEETAKKLQKASSKKNGASQQLGSKFVGEMQNMADVLSQEHQFLMSFWELLTSKKENSMEIYQIYSFCTKRNLIGTFNKKCVALENQANSNEQPLSTENGNESL